VRAAFIALAASGCVAQIPRSERPQLSDTATPFSLQSQSKPFELQTALGQGHVAIVFYRGFW
jgi:hypothetical protein